MKLITQTCLATVGFIALSVSASGAFAQTPGAQTPGAQNPDTGAAAALDAQSDEIVVTANKRSQSINDVPMSITAITGDNLVAAGIDDVSELARVVPGYTFTKTHDSIPVLSIRGVGYYDNNPGATPAVSAYVDEVPLPFPVMTSGALLDLERVEVLKGPQGTLFGQNSTGGAINFIAAKPLDHFESELSVGYGRFDAVDVTGYITGPLSETVTARLSGRVETASDWQRSYTRNDTLGQVDRAAGRLLVDWAARPDLNLELTVEHWTDQSDVQAGQLRGLSLQAPGCQDPALASGGPCIFFLPPGAPPPPITQVYPNAPEDARAADWTPGQDYSSNNRYWRGSLRADYDVSDALTLTSITSLQDFDFNQRADADGTALRIADLPSNADIASFYQELRLHGEAGPLDWLVGANYARDRVNDLASPTFVGWSVVIGTPFDQRITSNLRMETKAAFANMDYTLGNGLSVQAGARYTEVEQVQTACPADSGDGVAAGLFNGLFGGPFFGPGDCLVFNDTTGTTQTTRFDIPLKEDNVSWRVGMTYQPNADVLLYVNASEGYKAGSFTLATFQLVSQFTPATQESVRAYEAGFKVGGRTFQFNGAAFYYNYTDKQLLAPFDFGPFGFLDKLQNVPESRIMGAELQTLWEPVSGLQFNVNATYVDSEVTGSFIASSPFGAPIDLKGEAFPYTAEIQGLADVSYTFSLSDNLEGSLGTSVTYRGDSTARFGGGSVYTMNAYALLDLRAGIKTTDGRYGVDIWGRNVTDEHYLANITTNADTVFGLAGQPATYGVRGTVHF